MVITMEKIGLQLYSIRNHFNTPEEISDTFKKLKALGYDQAEMAGSHGLSYDRFYELAKEQGIEISLSTLRPFVSEEALNELSRLAAQYSDVNCTPDDIRLYLDRIARGTPVAGKAAEMSNDDLIRYLQSMREKKQGTDPADD